MYYTVLEVEAMLVEEVRENLEKVMIADRDSSNYEEAYLFDIEGDPLCMGVAYILNEDDVTANIVAGYEYDIK